MPMPNLEKVSAYSRSVAFRQQDNDNSAKATKCTSLTTNQAVPIDGYHGEGNSQASTRSLPPSAIIDRYDLSAIRDWQRYLIVVPLCLWARDALLQQRPTRTNKRTHRVMASI